MGTIASGDSGGSLGSAMYVWHQHLKNDKEETKQFDSNKEVI